MTYKTIIMCALLAGSMQNAWGTGEGNTALLALDTLVSEHGAICGSEEFEDVMPRIATFRKSLKKSSNPDMSLVNKAAEGLVSEFEAALKKYQDK